MSTNDMSKGRFPSSVISGVRETTRRIAASLNPMGGLSSNTSAKSSLQEPTYTVEHEVTHVEDPEEPPTALTRLASERPNPLADLESLLPVRDNFDDENGFISLCNDLLVLNYQEHRDPTRRTIKIPGTSGVLISPNQFYHAWHLLSQRGRDLKGGLLADEAGTGKTYLAFAACLLRAAAFESERAVRLYWSGKGKKKAGRQAEHHLAQGANGRSCPSQKPGSICCYCVPGSLTRVICDHTPSGVSALYCAAETWPDIISMVQTAGLNPSMYQLCLVHNNAPSRFTRPLQPLVPLLSQGAETDLKMFSPASYIFITTLESPRLRNVFSEATLNAGFIVIDEAHQILRKKDSLTLRMASELSGSGADVWFVTATPFSGCTLRDWVSPMELIAPRRAAATRSLAAALDTARSSGRAADLVSFRSHFDVVFDRDLVVRHFGTSKFLGKPISDVQDIVPRVISRETPLQHRDAVQELANQISYRDSQLSDPTQRGLLYLVSLFPAAAQLILDDPISVDTASIRDHVRQVKNRLHIEQSEPLRRLADQIVKDSPKLDYILEALTRMDQDKREREKLETQNTSRFGSGAGEDLMMKKMVIITPTVVSAVFLYLALIRHRPDVSLIHSWVSAQEKEQTINNFKSLSAAKLVKHTRVLIAPFSAIGTGANLQVASYEMLTSPLPDKTSQVQAFARTNRSGRRLRPLSHKILVTEDSPVDRIVLASHATLEIESDPFNIDEPLRMAGNIDLGSIDNQGSLNSPTGAVEDQMLLTDGSTLGVNEALTFQTALPFFPRPHTRDDGREGGDGGPEESSMIANEALLFQAASFWTPGDAEVDIPTIGGTESVMESDHPSRSSLSLFDELPHDASYPSLAGRAGEPARSMSAWLERDSSFRRHRHLTGTPAPQQLSIPTHHDLSHRPLPPLPTGAQPGGQSLDHERGWLTLLPPLAYGPPPRIDVGPTLASSRDQFASTTEETRAMLDGSDDQGDDAFSSSDDDWTTERPPTPYPDEMREYGDDIFESLQALGNVDFDVEDLIRTAQRSALLRQNRVST